MKKMKKMKKIIFSILIILGFTSCGYHIPMSDSLKYEIVDTVDIKYYNNPFVMTNYIVVVKMDSSFYSAKMNDNGKIYEITRRLKVKL